MRSVAGPTAVPPAGDRGVQRCHQEEGGGGGRLALAATVLAILALAALALTCPVFCVQLEAFQVGVSPDLQQRLSSVVQELGVHIPPRVSL